MIKTKRILIPLKYSIKQIYSTNTSISSKGIYDNKNFTNSSPT